LPDIARAIAEAIFLVVPDERLPARIAHDDAARFGDDGAATLLRLAPLGAEAFNVAWSLPCRVRRDRSQVLGARGRWRQRGCDGGRPVTGDRCTGRQRGLTAGSGGRMFRLGPVRRRGAARRSGRG
jgi:hypothetical protein